MQKSKGQKSSGKKRGGSGIVAGGTKLNRVSVKGRVRGKNSGGTNAAGDRMVQGASHDGSSSGKRNSG